MFRNKILSVIFALQPFVILAQIREEPIMIRTDHCDIQGTLTLPSAETKVVVLIVPEAGSVDRDCNNSVFLRTNAYRQYAITLAQNNIASVRYDKRGVGVSRLKTMTAEEVRFGMYVDDVKLWVKRLYWDFPTVVIAGHSEGSLVGMAAIGEGIPVSGFISIAGSGRRFDRVLLDNISKNWPELEQSAREVISVLATGRRVDNVPFYLRNFLHPTLQPFIISKISYDPLMIISKLKLPMLILQGDSDMEMTPNDAKQLWKANPKAKMVIVPGMNHVMKDCPSANMLYQEDTYKNPTHLLNSKLIVESVKFIETL